jgi:hypothetical protein
MSGGPKASKRSNAGAQSAGAKVDKVNTKANVCIVESLGFLEETVHKEGEIISRTLMSSGKRPSYTYVRSREDFEAFIKEFGKSPYRYLHLSCHGHKNGFWTTHGMIHAPEMVKILSPHLRGRRLFVSACLATNSKFAKELLEKSECYSVLGPAGSPYFDDAAIFWTSFYHLMFKNNPAAMQSTDIAINAQKCARLVDETFRFFYRRNGKIVEKTIGENCLLKCNASLAL